MEWPVITTLALALASARGSDIYETTTTVPVNKVHVNKCCEVDSLLVESSLGARECRRRTELLHVDVRMARAKWEPSFHDASTGREVIGPQVYVLDIGIPRCDLKAGEHMFPVSHSRRTDDELMLLTNGTLSHQLVHERDNATSMRFLYPTAKYCIDDLIATHNFTAGADAAEQDIVLEFAYICVNNAMDVQHIVEAYVYPIGLAVSMMCLILTFLLYAFLPQLRDLTGKFILGICSFLSIAFALMLVNIFGWKDPNVEKLVTEMLLHTSIVGVWFCLNAMGHHVWKIIRSKSVFTRVTDGQRLRYYTIYIVLCTALVAGLAVCVHFFIARGEGVGKFKIGWSCLAAFYIPVAVVLIVNVMFYWTSQKRISRQLVYNRSMQHFQVNFDLYTKFLIVVGIWWLFQTLSLIQMSALKYISMVFNLLQGPLVFCIAMCRTRVAFLFKKYFCEDWCCFGCCKSEEFIDEECEELATIDLLKHREERNDAAVPNGSLLSPTSNGNSSNDRELSRSLFNVRHREPGEIPPPPDPELPVGRIKRLLKSNSLTAITNINFGWRRETSV